MMMMMMVVVVVMMMMMMVVMMMVLLLLLMMMMMLVVVAVMMMARTIASETGHYLGHHCTAPCNAHSTGRWERKGRSARERTLMLQVNSCKSASQSLVMLSPTRRCR
jgi:hypothetical protein